jgi:hypothetical protein
MLIIVDEDRMPDGTHVGWHLLDTTDAAAHAALVALSGNAVGQQNAAGIVRPLTRPLSPMRRAGRFSSGNWRRLPPMIHSRSRIWCESGGGPIVDKSLLGKILATAVLGLAVASEAAGGSVSGSSLDAEIKQITDGIFAVWLSHPKNKPA